MINISCYYIFAGLSMYQNKLWDAWIDCKSQGEIDEIANKTKCFIMKTLSIGKKNKANKRIVNIFLARYSPNTFKGSNIVKASLAEVEKLPKNKDFDIFKNG